MLKKLLNLLPASFVRQIENSCFANLQDRGEIKVSINDEKELIEKEKNDSIPEIFYYLGLNFKIVRCYRMQSKSRIFWCHDWFVFDGIKLIAEGKSNFEENAIASAKKWIEDNVKAHTQEG